MNHVIAFLILGLLFLAVIAVLVFVVIANAAGQPKGADIYPYRKKDYLLSKAERVFFDALLSAVGDRLFIFCKVRMQDVLFLPKGTTERQSWLNKVRQKHLDFVLCERQSIGPVLVIELDDSSHQREDARKRDAFKNKSLQDAGLPILRVNVQKSYDPTQLAELIQQAV